ncbi:hypothetical protein L3X38_036849 [Prunus dulcis]|uniref:RNase H type-1 domain-containing protein n=1 Tax=Prunus dulcis TaxID=3755 RepID=A0AAD4V3Z2_PRUDU|nr:hypothetical protein L3X38_036849 [Prunus dulcis]
MKSPSTVKEIQSLTGRAAALNRFLSKSTNKCRPFFKTLKKGQKDKWDEECEVAFQSLKTYVTSPPLLSKPVSAAHEVGNRAKATRPPLLAKDCNKKPGLSRLSCRIHTISRRREASQQKEGSSRADKTSTEPDQPRDMWQLRVDEASNQKGAGAGVVIVTLDGTLLEQVITLGFPASNNEAEYEALLAGLRLANELSIKKLAIYSDSQLITSQASGEYMAKHPRMILYLDKVQELLKAFPTFTIQQVLRAENAHADALASLGSALDTQFRRSILVEFLDQPSIEEAEQPDLM